MIRFYVICYRFITNACFHTIHSIVGSPTDSVSTSYSCFILEIFIYRLLIYCFFCLGEDSIFTHRELSFTLADEVYIRYLSYENRKDFENDLISKCPFKIDIGAVMSARPRDHRTTNLQPVQRELIFDIDMTDYDEVRSCCSGADICQKCWKFMVVACQIIDSTLRGMQ